MPLDISWTVVLIASINLTPGKDPMKFCKYHQILLLYIGYEILTSILDTALNETLVSILNPGKDNFGQQITANKNLFT